MSDENKPESLFDHRIVHRNIARGLISQEEYDAWLDKQEDCAEHGQESEVRFVYSNRGGDTEAEA